MTDHIPPCFKCGGSLHYLIDESLMKMDSHYVVHRHECFRCNATRGLGRTEKAAERDARSKRLFGSRQRAKQRPADEKAQKTWKHALQHLGGAGNE